MLNSKNDRTVVKLLRHQAALAALGSFAFLEPDLPTVLTEAARICAIALEVPFCNICRYRADKNDFLIVAGWGWHLGVVGQVVSQADDSSPQGRAYITGKPVIIHNLQVANSLALPDFYKEHDIVSTADMVIPAIGGAAYGVLEISSTRQPQYDEHDITFLTGFANVLAEAVATATRVKALQDALDASFANVLAEAAVTATRVKALQDILDGNFANVLAEAVVTATRVKALQDALDAKNLLADELHHRVRNNLQMIVGMLDNYTRRMASDTAQGGIDLIMRRVTTLAQVYDSLLSVGLSGTVDLAGYLRALCTSLPAMQAEHSHPVHVVYRAEPVMLGVEETSTLGMAVAELVTNSYDHAFPNRGGTVSVTLARISPTEATLTVEDNGAGFPVKTETGVQRNGLALVRRLMNQIGGTSNNHFNAGTVWNLRFPVPVMSDETKVTA